MNIKETFLKLTERTYPHGTEQDLFHLLPQDLSTDSFGNLYIQIGEKPSTMFTSHLDTASSQVQKITHKIEGDIISTDGHSILGADDKAGVTILLNMIKNNIPGLYYFFLGEERGCIGSRKLANSHKTNPLTNINKVVSFDRRGTDSVITHQLGGRCCSDKFGRELSKQLNNIDGDFNYEIDPTGIYTDSAQFIEIYSECTNISVGYNYEHTHSEFQNILHLEKLANAVLKVDWDNLPIERDKSKYEDEYDEFEFGYSRYSKKQEKTHETVNGSNSWTTTYYFKDPVYLGGTSSVTYNRYTKLPIDFKMNQGRIEYEEDLIYHFLNTMDLDVENFSWCGKELVVEYINGDQTTTSREELGEFIEELNFWRQLVKV
jgi:hypothetical protein